jgi:glycosyltransferase involved in cell wall biosynthesis
LSKRRNILVFIDWYLPGYKAGGPIQSFANIVSHLTEGFYFSIVTRNTDFNSSEPYANVKTNTWNELGDNHRVYYISKDKLTKGLIQSFITNEYDVIYFNSLYSFYFSIYPLHKATQGGIKTILAPRGMLGKGALQIKSFKKVAFLAIIKQLRAYKKTIWQASSELEAAEIKSVFGNTALIKVVKNLVANTTITFNKKVKEKNSLHLFFLSRISPIKNLEFALAILQKVNPVYQLKYSIIGPIENKVYWDNCLQKIKLLQSYKNITIEYIGEMNRTEVMNYINQYHVLLLPTLNENFGHSIVDAFAASCPVIISNRTPWLKLKEEEVGFDIDLTKEEDFILSIEFFANLTETEFNSYALTAFNKAQNFYNNESLIQQTKQLFL